jgi:hypothetical protein
MSPREQAIANVAKAEGLRAAARVIEAIAADAMRVVGTNRLKEAAQSMRSAAKKLEGGE